MSFDERLINTEKRLGIKLPEDYIEFIKIHEGQTSGFDEWFYIDHLEFSTEYDVLEFLIIEERPDILNKEDCKYLIPILKDNDAYAVIDTRKDGKGVFMIWSDEVELGFQSPNFKSFIDKIKKEFYENNNPLYDYFSLDNEV